MHPLKLYHLVLLWSSLTFATVAIEEDADAITTTAAVPADTHTSSLASRSDDTSSESVFTAGLLVKAESVESFAAGLEGVNSGLPDTLCKAFLAISNVSTVQLTSTSYHSSRRLRGSRDHHRDEKVGRALSSIAGFSLLFQAEAPKLAVESGEVSSQSIAQALWERFLNEVNAQAVTQYRLSSVLQVTVALDPSHEIEFSLDLLTQAGSTSSSKAMDDWEAGTVAAILCLTLAFVGSVALGARLLCMRLTRRVEEEQRRQREEAEEAGEEDSEASEEGELEEEGASDEHAESQAQAQAQGVIVDLEGAGAASSPAQLAQQEEPVVELDAVNLGLASSIGPVTRSAPPEFPPTLASTSSSADQGICCRQPPPPPEETSTNNSSTGDASEMRFGAVARVYTSSSDPSWEPTPATSAGLRSWPQDGPQSSHPAGSKEASVEAQTEADTASPASEIRSSLPVSLCPTDVSRAPTER